MSDTPQTTAELIAACPDNTTGAITAQVLRDVIVSMVNKEDVSGTPSTSTFLRGDLAWEPGVAGPQGFQGNQGFQGVAGPQGFQGVAGAVGSQGFQGNQGGTGNQGPTGDFGGVGSIWLLNSVSGTTPTTSQFSVNNATATNISQIKVHQTDDNGTTLLSGFLNTVAVGDLIRLAPPNGTANPSMLGTVSSISATAGVYTFSITNLGGNGTFAASTVYGLWTSPKGAAGGSGASGAQGSQGPQGAAGLVGAAGAQGSRGQTGQTGPQGSTGATGPTGQTGPSGGSGSAGPNTVDTSTSTPLSGMLYGNGSNVNSDPAINTDGSGNLTVGGLCLGCSGPAPSSQITFGSFAVDNTAHVFTGEITCGGTLVCGGNSICDGSLSAVIAFDGVGNILLPQLPTSDPHVAHMLWNSSGTLKVSAG